MLRMRAVVVLGVATHVRSDAFSLVNQLDRAPGRPAPERLADQGVRRAVEVVIEVHVIVDVDADLLLFGVLVRVDRKSFERGTVEPLVELAP
jgi:hypothetical protein